MYEIRKLKTFRGHEGPGFNCELWFKEGGLEHKLAFVRDMGEGGQVDFDWEDHRAKQVDGIDEDGALRYFTPEEHAFLMFSMQETWICNGKTIPKSMDIKIGEMVAQVEEDVKLRRWCKTKTVVRLKSDDPGVNSYLTYDEPYTQKLHDEIMKMHGGRVLEIVNERLGKMVGEQEAQDAWLRQLCAKKTVVHIKGDPPDKFKMLKAKWNPAFSPRIRSAHPQVDEIVNERFAN